MPDYAQRRAILILAGLIAAVMLEYVRSTYAPGISVHVISAGFFATGIAVFLYWRKQKQR
jgi:hypothetical protein